MFGFIKKAFFVGLIFLSTLTSINLLSAISLRVTSLSAAPLNAIPLSCIKYKVRPEIFNANSDEHVFYPFSIKTRNAVVVATISIIYM